MSEGYVDDSVFRSGVVTAVIEDDRVIAFAGGKIVDIRSVHKELTQGGLSDRFGDCVRENDKVGILSIVAVRAENEGSGHGRSVTESVLSMLQQRVSLVFGEAWIRKGQSSGENLLRSLDFLILYKSDRYWKPKTDESYQPCPECHSSPCECSGALFYKPV